MKAITLNSPGSPGSPVGKRKRSVSSKTTTTTTKMTKKTKPSRSSSPQFKAGTSNVSFKGTSSGKSSKRTLVRKSPKNKKTTNKSSMSVSFKSSKGSSERIRKSSSSFKVSLISSSGKSNDRFQLFDNVTSFTDLFSYSDSICLNNKNFLNKILVENRIGSDSLNGEVQRSCYPIICPHSGNIGSASRCSCANNAVTLALKKVPVYPDTPLIQPSRDDITDPYWTKYEMYAEIVCLRLVTFLVREGVCPNLPMFFAYFPCDHCTFENTKINNRFEKFETKPRTRAASKLPVTTSNRRSCLLMLNEFASGGDFSDWCGTTRSFEEWMNAYFQIFIALAAIQRYFNMTHFDLHWGNILVHNIPKGGYWKYTLNKKNYYIPNLGFLLVLWDFGYALIPGKIEIADQLGVRQKSMKGIWNTSAIDYKNISSAPKWTLEDYKKVQVPPFMTTDFNFFINQQLNIDKLIEELYVPFTNKPLPSTGPLLQSYSLDKSISVPQQYRKYVEPQYLKF